MNNIDFIKSLYAAFLSGGIDKILAAADPHIEWKSNTDPGLLPWGGERKGIEQVTAFFSELALNVEIESFTPREYLSGPGFVVVTGHTTGRMRRSGVRFDDDWCHVFKIVGGKVTTVHEFVDTHALVQAFIGGNVHAIGLPSSAMETITPRSH
ncbi:nuclear transport factor 2 family protein [Rhodoblastus acidophilus]|uniref:Nuclear transport factor 2 family protein n=1 Tax=Candidatus Rhodoblastus alkanivorans TaxID=2954117 RepID=A0ABS9ZCB0_9HYPH|nr:nuclear transport factor 2 family protein [Candidatus Rhodoblastus alkanivorans]MCI4680906.1 nuclear transport factor 2 family protein [Candidatus Rhodoblastus alkanivorans]MCI4684232.1 nuclear transport factor 2 family protein [Candidatus Rhodoblastus alkanivorans]MDI4641553.1 nuclear transport factor 2 family protein [Rhodoblastus acidophilus]